MGSLLTIDDQNAVLGHSLVTPFLDPKMNVFGSQNRFANLVDPKLVIFQVSIFGYFFRVRLHPKKGTVFG